ncbi:MAG TPA: hypothetical protein VHC90_01895 [Bryobacteraceae bacterium]|nr:hypothetical protein [Bryobacteraceae bacterium]
MPKIDTTRRIAIEVSGETVTFICRVPTGDEQSKFLNSRFTTKRNKVESNVYPARAAFIDNIAVDVEGATFVDAQGAEKPLNASTSFTDADKAKWAKALGLRSIDSWKDLIPLSWKSSAAQQFEDSANAGEDDGKN